MTYKGAEKLEGMILWWASLDGPKATPGSYKVVLSVNKKVQTKTFSVLADPEKQYKDDETVEDLLEKVKTLKESFTKIEEALYQTKNKSNQDPLNFPIRLTNKLGHLNALVRMGDFAPTQQDIAVKEELTKKIEIQLQQFNTLVNQEISAFNTAFNSKKLNYLFIED